MIIRVDDVSTNTDMGDLEKISNMFQKDFNAQVIWGVTIYSKRANGSVYPDLPLKTRSLSYLCDINQGFSRCIPSWVTIASHGLIHAKHGELSRDAQMISIKTSCSILGTSIFIPPFMSYNEDTVSICKDEGIELIKEHWWKSMEREVFDPNQIHWYFHHWRMNSGEVERWINAGKINA